MSAVVIDFYQSAEILANKELPTDDGVYTNHQLIHIIRDLVNKITDNEQIHRSIIESFTPTGIVEIYNELGIDGFKDLISDMANHENNERSKYG